MADLDNTLGAVFVAVVVAAILYGFTCVQTWYYYTEYPSDPWYLKLLVLTSLVLDTCHQALITHMVYTLAITKFGEYEELNNVVWSMVVEVFFNAFTTLLVQSFLTVRIYRLSGKNWLATGIVFIFVIAEFLAAFIFSVEALPFKTWSEFATLNDLSMTVNAFAVAGDIIITGSLCYLLHTSRTGFEKSDTMISKLIMFSINTGLLTSLCALASLISISVWPQAWIYLGFYYCIGRLYCNSLLATLNARRRLRSGFYQDDISLSVRSQSAPQKSDHTMVRTPSRHMPNNISIKIDTTRDYIRDEFSSSNGDLKDPKVVVV